MLAGHYATALIAEQKTPRNTLLFFVIASQLQDFLWFAFHYLGLETTGPHDVMDTTLTNMSVNMLYSHDALPQLLWAGILFLVGCVGFKSIKVALIAVALFASHFVLDFFSGHPHHVFGEETHEVGLGLYATNVYLAIFIELAFIIAALWYYFRQQKAMGVKMQTKSKLAIIGVFAFGITFMLSVATVSMRELLNIPELNLGFNTTVPTMLLTYLAMAWVLVKFAPRHNG